jgi:hypothetical protein
MSTEHLELHHSHCLLLAKLPGSSGGAAAARRGGGGRRRRRGVAVGRDRSGVARSFAYAGIERAWVNARHSAADLLIAAVEAYPAARAAWSGGRAGSVWWRRAARARSIR